MDNLQFKVKDINDRETVTHQITCDAEDTNLRGETDVKFIRPITGVVKLYRQNTQIYVTANLATAVEVECSRCLEIFPVELEAHFGTEYRPTSNPGKVGWLGEDQEIRYYNGEYIDISEDICQAIVVEIPLWPICSEDCKGLCHKCGHNLNLGDCDCVKISEKSSPFSVLGELLKDAKQAADGG